MTRRKSDKAESFKRVLETASARFRKDGFSGAGIASIMKDAGLTHGAFYAHFSNKNELVEKAFQHALSQNRPRWIPPARKESWSARLKLLSKRYLTRAHRDDLADSCALAALVSDAARTGPEFRSTYENELLKSLEAVCDGQFTSGTKFDEALVFMALCIGGISMSRAVRDKDLSDKILDACRSASPRLASDEDAAAAGRESIKKIAKTDQALPLLDAFAVQTYDKLRYSDTDRQGHINNAVFSTLLETGRVEILYDPSLPMARDNCTFVIAHQSLDFHSELVWPGRVDIGSQIVSLGRSSIIFRHGLFQDGRCAATAKVVIVQVNQTTKRAEPLAEPTITRLSELMNDTGKGEEND